MFYFSNEMIFLVDSEWATSGNFLGSWFSIMGVGGWVLPCPSTNTLWKEVAVITRVKLQSKRTDYLQSVSYTFVVIVSGTITVTDCGPYLYKNKDHYLTKTLTK